MSVAVKKKKGVKAELRKCAWRSWRLVPHLLLCLSLVAYAALGALMFAHIEGNGLKVLNYTRPPEYQRFLTRIVSTVQNLTSKWPLISVWASLLKLFYVGFNL